MRDYVIIADSTHDLSMGFIEENNIGIVSLSFELDGNIYASNKELSSKEFYQGMRKDLPTKTSAVNPDKFKELFLEYIKEGKDILCMSLSSGISSTANNSVIAKNELEEEYPDAKIEVIDSLCASGGQGMLLYRAVQNQKAGMSLEDNYKKLESEKLNIVHKFTVDDLKYLHRGGRVSKATAVIGTIVNVKPLLHVDNEGKLVAETKTRGRKKSLEKLVKDMGACMGSWKDKQDLIIVSHADVFEDAQFCIDLIKEKYSPKETMITDVTPTIGAHSGPGTIAIFFMGDVR